MAKSSFTALLSPKPLSLLLTLCFLPLLFTFSFKSSPPNPSPSSSSSSSSLTGIRIRSGNGNYEEYISKQLNKTLDPRLRQIWKTRDWERKVKVFSAFFELLKKENLLSNSSKALCIGARTGQEVAALRRVGVADSVGMDLVPAPPLVVAGDFHKQPFEKESFDFEFSNVFDHALFPEKFVSEIERTLKSGGVCVLHVAVRRRGDRYSANDLLNVDGLLGLFQCSDLVRSRKVDGFGLDTEIVMRKRKSCS